MKIIFATGNKGKLKEVQNIFENTKFEVVSLYDFGEVPKIIEDADTFEGNAKIKAEAIYDIHKIPVIADDSGLAVDQLNGEPGVYSARYAGENCTYDDNNKKVLEALSEFPQPHNAQFLCCAVFFDGQKHLASMGVLPGEIVRESRGGHGFGYDPIFKPDGAKKTLAEMSLEEKNKISHRAKAFNKLKTMMVDLIKM